MKKILSAFICCIAFFSVTAQSTQSSTDESITVSRPLRTAEEGLRDEEFRRGVQSFYRGSFNDAVLRFEKALSYLPNDNLVLDWLGKSYYRSGMEGFALDLWQTASTSGYGGSLLQDRIEIVRDRRITGVDQETQLDYTEAGSFPGVNGKNMIFSQPISVLPNPDGTVWLLSYGSNDLLLFDINGLAINRITGPINGFDRPLDIIRMNDGSLLVSESAGDRLSMFTARGKFIKNIGSKGRGLGEMLGPQYLAQDSYGNIYVSDYGNCRIDVFDNEGNPLLYFGGKSDEFLGLQGPTGIAVYQDRIFVSDSIKGGIYEFDRSGNYVGILVEPGTFKHPEALKLWDGWLITCDSNKVISIDIRTGATFENAHTGNAPSRLTSAVPDVNGNILVTDMVSNEMYIMSKMSELIGGLFVQIEQVNADRFPEVTLKLRVENRHRQSVVGLLENNFYLSENNRPVADMKLVGAANNNQSADVTLVIDRSPETQRQNDSLEAAVREIAESMHHQGTLRIVSSGVVPVTEYEGDPDGALRFVSSGLRSPITTSGALDLAVRLAANDLIRGQEKRAIIYLTAGTVSQNAFTKYALSDIAAYLNNNSIIFDVIQLSQQSPADELTYLSSHTCGESYFVYRPEGLSAVIQDVLQQPSGLYQLTYRSAMPTNFGQAYLPLEAEVYLMNRSGRDETGYFAPLQ